MLPDYFAGSRKFALLGLVFLALLQASLAIVIAFNMRELFARLNESSAQIPLGLIILIGSCSLGITLLRLLERMLADKTGHDYTMAMRERLFSHISRVSQDKLDEHQQGSLNLRFIGDLNAIRNWVSLGIPRLIAASILLPALLYLLYWLHPVMFAFACMVLLCGFFTMYWLKDSLLPFHKKMRVRRGAIATYINERLRFAPQLRVAGQRTQIVNVLKRKSLSLRTASGKKHMVTGGFRAIPEACLIIITALCFGLAFHLQLGTAEAAVMVAIIAIFNQPLKDVAGFWDRRHAFLVASRKCQDILHIPSVTKGRKRAPTELAKPVITNSRSSVRDLNFPASRIGFGERILVTGKNGSGKSSFLKLLAGITDADRGKVKIGGANVLRIPERLRAQMLFYQGAQVPMFKSTLHHCLTFMCHRTPTDKHILKGIELFDLVGLYLRLGGLDGKIQEGGRNLSAGETKRIALCRAWLSDSKILILDEIDDALDKSALALVDTLLDKPDVTIILVSHRLVDSSKFDQVIDLCA